MILKLQFAMLAAVLVCVACRADTVCLTDGSEVEGTVVEDNANTVVIKRSNGAVQSFRRTDVDAVVYEKKAAPAAVPAPVARKSASDLKADEPTPKKGAPARPEVGDAKTPDNTATPAQPDAKEGEPKPRASDATVVKEGEVKPKAPEAAGAKEGGAAPKEGAAAKDPSAAKPDDRTADPAAKKDEGKSKETVAAKEGTGKEEEWTAPPGLAGFPKEAKRLPEEKEKIFMAALTSLNTMDDGPRQAAEAEISALGPAAVPYLVAGSYDTSIPTRTSCMTLIGRLNGRNAIKQVIELFYSAIPAEGEPATFQGPFLQAIRTTLPTISGQDFFTADPRRPIVQEFIKRYVEWYNDNFDRLPPQLGEPKVEPTDPDYMKKIKEARALKLEKRSWPRPPLSADIVGEGKPGINRTQPSAKEMVRPADKAYSKETIPTVKNDAVGKRY